MKLLNEVASRLEELANHYAEEIELERCIRLLVNPTKEVTMLEERLIK